jgi:hypothetical protein
MFESTNLPTLFAEATTRRLAPGMGENGQSMLDPHRDRVQLFKGTGNIAVAIISMIIKWQIHMQWLDIPQELLHIWRCHIEMISSSS